MDKRYTAGKQVAMLGIFINIVLLAIKLYTGYSANSQAMIADGFNSLGDVFASVVTLFGSIYAAKPKDEEHIFGHGKAEFIASLIIGLSMVIMAAYTGFNSVNSLLNAQKAEFSFLLVIVAVITICAKGILFVYCIKKSKAYNSILIKANAYDHRNDVFVTTGTLVAIFLGVAGVYWFDGAVGIAISCWIAYVGINIIKDSSDILMDSNAKKEDISKYYEDILSIDGVDHIDSVVAKPIGAKYILIVKVSVDKEMSVITSHKIAKEIENILLTKREEVEDIIVHINPN